MIVLLHTKYKDSKAMWRWGLNSKKFVGAKNVNVHVDNR